MSAPSTADLLRVKAAEARAAIAAAAAVVVERDALIRKMAAEPGVTQREVAAAAGLSEMAISKQLRRS